MNKANWFFCICLFFMYCMGYLMSYITNRYFKNNEDDDINGDEIQES